MATTRTGRWGLLIALGCRRGAEPPREDLVINEVLADNRAAWAAPDPPPGTCPDHPDLVELWNPTARELALSAYTLEDEGHAPFALSGRLAAGARALLVADGSAEAPGHLPFGVSAEGETLVLRRAGRAVDRVEVPATDPDRSWARLGDGGPAWTRQLPSPGAPNEAPPADPCFPPPPGAFDDHGVPCVSRRVGYDALAVGRAGLSVVKAEILGFPTDDDLEVRFLDGRFYALHDEWYLFRMLNGEEVRGEDLYEPWHGRAFADLGELRAWAYATDLAATFPEAYVTVLPNGRVYSPRFYTLALGEPRRIAATSLLHVDADRDGIERWAFELEHTDGVLASELAAMFRIFDARLGAEVGGPGAPAEQRLRWLPRSTAQIALADALPADLAARVLPYDRLAAPGALEVYRGGTVAGTVFVSRGGERLEEARATDLLVVDEIPDYLPPCAALVTGIPQTPLAHVALLAESRGIPNLSVAGAADDPQWDTWGRVRAPVALRATPGVDGAPATLELLPLDDGEWRTWQGLQDAAAPVLEPVPTDGLPWVVDLATIPVDEMAEMRPVLGGKSAGYLALLHTPGVIAPDPVLGVTIRAYATQLAPLADPIAALLADPVFARPGDERARYLVLEGRDAYDARYPTAVDAVAAEAFVSAHPGDLGDLAAGDGLVGEVAAGPLAPAVAGPVRRALQEAFGDLAADQGLRFRSSSNVEDAEGFVGAGLYTSNTGYLEPPPGEDTIEDAMLATFSSYWGAEAFEERHAAGLDHAAGAMGLTVHPNFADEDERANGVLHLVRLPDGTTELTVNSQIGAISVTNPPVDTCTVILPQVDVIRGDAVGGGVAERLQDSTESPRVLGEADLLDLFDQSLPVLDTWLGVENAALAAPARRTSLTLDLEFRAVVDAWPRYADGHGSGERLVLKQCRSLEPSAAALPDDVEALPFPRDLLGRARIVTFRDCEGPPGGARVWAATTDPTKPPDLGHAEVPFVAQVEVGGEVADWTAFEAQDARRVRLGAEAAARLGVDELPLGACADQTLWAAPATWLDDLLDAAR